jgi:hypothetical protein
MSPPPRHADSTIPMLARRQFLTSSANGLGAAALGALLTDEGVLAADSTKASSARSSHFAPRAKACIFVFMAGGPSHVDLFDPKPKLNELDGQRLPQELLAESRFAFLKPDTATIMGSPRKFYRHGECGMELSELLPRLGSCADDLLLIRSLHSEQFNHHPAQLLMQCGASRFGMPTMGAWINYGLGSESKNLPGYVVLTAGRGTSGGATLYQSGFLPSPYGGVLFRNTGEPVLNLDNPAGVDRQQQLRELDAVRELNQRRLSQVHDPQIAARIDNYELAGRMQLSAPELTDLTQESRHTLDLYGVDRPEPDPGNHRGTFAHLQTYQAFARNCLLARRMVERGVRFVNIIHASWDQHANLDADIAYNAGIVDQPIAALIQDLKQRGMLDETLVVWGSEFGRTPMVEQPDAEQRSGTGRDHHPSCYSTLMAGGGLKGGTVYGASDEFGYHPAENPVHANDLHATLLHQFGLDHLKLTYRFQGRDFRLTDVGGNVIHDWIA